MPRLTLPLAALLLITVAAVQAAAQSDGMEVQRCVWRCLYASNGASDPAYNACVASRCSEQALGLTPDAAPWTAGVTADGTGMFAGTGDPVQGTSLYVICQRRGATYLGLFGPEGPDGQMILRVDGAPYPLAFRADGGVSHYALLPQGSPVLAALQTGREAEVLNDAGYSLVKVTLSGAGPAITQALNGCRP